MGKMLSEEKKENVKNEVLKFLSIDGRRSITDMATKLKIPKATFYHMYMDIIQEYDLKFVPEINIEEIWKYEFMRMSKRGGKKEVIERQIDKSGRIGFGEYVVFLKFTRKMPSEDELLAAMSHNYFLQFMAKLQGSYDVFMYGIARTYREASTIVEEFLERLNYDMDIVVSRVFTEYGFFPLRKELLEQFEIIDTYKSLLLSLNEDGRKEFQEIAKTNKKTPEHFMYAYQMIKRSGILDRITYYESNPKNNVNALIMVQITNAHALKKTVNNLYKDVISYKHKHNEYVHLCDTSSPYGMLITCSFTGSDELGKFIERLKKNLDGVSISTQLITKIAYGHLGIRNFDARYSMQYRRLERQKLVQSFDPVRGETF